MKGLVLIVFCFLIACCLAAPTVNKPADVKVEVPIETQVAATATEIESKPSVRVGIIGTLLGIPTTTLRPDAVVVVVNKGGIVAATQA